MCNYFLSQQLFPFTTISKRRNKKKGKKKENQAKITSPLLKTGYVNRIISRDIFMQFQMAF